MKLSINVSIPYLWGDHKFQRDEWGSINYLVGPNGTGKTLFAEQLRQQCKAQGLTVRYLSTERLTGLQRRNYNYFGMSYIESGLNIGRFSDYKSYGKNYGLAADAFVILKEKLDLKIKIEATLSQLFDRRIRLAEEGGFLKPKIQKIAAGDEYDLKENECHGLKELITLMTFLYNDDHNCLIIDEPELHLHPQFQTFFLQEIRNVAGDPLSTPGKKCFFIVTHSPYYVDVRTIADLRNCVVFQPDKLPAFIGQLDEEDEWKIERLLPRLNTHHKQFFFASRPIFVEGYFDQQTFALIQEKRGKFLGASGSCIIDVGGKDELDLFFRLCKRLGIDAQFIADLDAITQGKLRQSVSEDERCRTYLQSEGLGINLMETMGKVEQAVNECVNEIERKMATVSLSDARSQNFQSSLSQATELEKKRYLFLLGLRYIRKQIQDLIPSYVGNISYIEGRLTKIIKSFKSCRVHVLPKGELENYLPEYQGNPFKISEEDKTKTFERERDFLLHESLAEEEVRSRYGDLVNILDEASASNIIDMDSFLSYAIGNWIHRVQSGFARGEIRDANSLKRNALVDWKTHSRIFDLVDFSKTVKGFTCRIKLKPLVDSKEREVAFSHKTVAANFQLK